MQAEVLWLMAAKTKWQESDAQKRESEAARRAGDEKAAAQLLQQSRELLEAARGILYSANIANSGMQTYTDMQLSDGATLSGPLGSAVCWRMTH